MPKTKRFLSPAGATEDEALMVPAALDEGPLLNMLVESVGRLAAWEERFAGDVLNDLLETAKGVATNGASRVQIGSS